MANKKYKLANPNRPYEILAQLEQLVKEVEAEIEALHNSKLRYKGKVQYTHINEQSIKLDGLRHWIRKLESNIIDNKMLNDYLLDDALSFNEALFLPLMFDPTMLDFLPDDSRTSVLLDCLFLDFIFNNKINEFRWLDKSWEELTNKKISYIEFLFSKRLLVEDTTSLIKPPIPTEDFIDSAIDKKILKNSKSNKKDHQETGNKGERNYPEWLAKELYKQLTEQNLISGDYGSMWQWLPKHKNTLSFLADRLTACFEEECPLNRKQPNLTAYIKYSGTDFRKVSETTDRVIISKIDTVIQNLLSKRPK